MKTMGMSLMIISVLAFVPGGCATSISQQITALNVGCKMNEMQISNEKVELNGEESWTVKCEGKTYYCTYLPESGSNCFEIIE
jgi:hypothetical protein